VEDGLELPYQLGCGQMGDLSELFQVQAFHKSRMQMIFGNAQPPMDLIPRGCFQGPYPVGIVGFGLMPADQMGKDEHQPLIYHGLDIALSVQRRHESLESGLQPRIGVVYRLKEFQGPFLKVEGIIQQRFFSIQVIPKDSTDKCRAEKNRLYPHFARRIDPAGILLVVIQYQEPARSQHQLPAIHTVPLLSTQNPFDGKTADVSVAKAPEGNGIENDVLPPEPAEMQPLIECRIGMVGQAGKVHGLIVYNFSSPGKYTTEGMKFEAAVD